MSMHIDSFDVVIIGGGVIGLSLAWELAQGNARVAVLEKAEPGRQASWAGAGMIPPGPTPSNRAASSATEQLAGLSAELHASWHDRLREATGIDNGYRRCGAIYLHDSAETQLADATRWQRLGIEYTKLDRNALREMAPAIDVDSGVADFATRLPGEAQIRNPRHLRALQVACKQAGVQIIPHREVRSFRTEANQITRAVAAHQEFSANQFCITAGAWSTALADTLNVRLRLRPIRGQIAMLAGPRGLLTQIIDVGRRYLVPRDDGRILVGSTEEDAGFACHTTDEGIAGLLAFATDLAPSLASSPIEQTWAGLRPATLDGNPIIGRVGDWQNCWIAAGHFRAGLQLSTGTAVVMAAMMRGIAPPLDVSRVSTQDCDGELSSS